MADTLKKIYLGQPAISNTTLYTVPTGTKTIIKSIVIVNTISSTATVTLKAGGQTIISSYSVTPHNTVVINDLGILEAGDLIEGSQGTENAISVWISGMEVV